MISLEDLPTLNACLNSLSAILLLRGGWMIRQRRVPSHRNAMLGAVLVSALFLVSYLTYHFNHEPTRFKGTGAIRIVYFSILISHTVLATLVVPMVSVTLFHAWRNQLDRHRKLARATLPIWLYVSVTGVLVYLILYKGLLGS